MAEAKTCVLRTKKFMKNPLLKRKQFVVEVLHEGRASVPKAEIRTKLSTLYKAPEDNIFVWGFRTAFGGGRSTGFGVIYDDKRSALSYTSRYLKIRHNLAKKSVESRKLRKDKKNRAKKFRGKARAAVLYGKDSKAGGKGKKK